MDSVRTFHQHLDVLQKCGQYRRRALVAHVRWNRAGQGSAGGDVELGAVHGAGNELPRSSVPNSSGAFMCPQRRSMA